MGYREIGTEVDSNETTRNTHLNRWHITNASSLCIKIKELGHIQVGTLFWNKSVRQIVFTLVSRVSCFSHSLLNPTKNCARTTSTTLSISWSADKVENCSNSIPKLTVIHEQTRRRTFLKVYPKPPGIRLRAGHD